MKQFTAVNHLIDIQLQDVKDNSMSYTQLNDYQVSYLCQCAEYVSKSANGKGLDFDTSKQGSKTKFDYQINMQRNDIYDKLINTQNKTEAMFLKDIYTDGMSK